MYPVGQNNTAYIDVLTSSPIPLFTTTCWREIFGRKNLEDATQFGFQWMASRNILLTAKIGIRDSNSLHDLKRHEQAGLNYCCPSSGMVAHAGFPLKPVSRLRYEFHTTS